MIVGKLVLHHVLVGVFARFFPRRLQLRDLLLIAIHQAVVLAVILGINRFHLRQRRFFRRDVGGPDIVRSLEGHVLHHVRQPGLALGILRIAGVHHGEKGEDRRLRTPQQNHGKSIGKGSNLNSFLKRC